MEVSAADCRKIDRALELEWLETNGRGGFSSGTVSGANTRRYHALLLVARNPPVHRYNFVNHVDEWVEVGGQAFSLSSNVYSGIVHPDGYRRCAGFTTIPWPTWLYEDQGIQIQRELFIPAERDMIVMRWHLLTEGTPPVRLKIRPMLTGRDYHSTHHENGAVLVQAWISERNVAWQPYDGLPKVYACHNGDYHHAPDWYRRVQFPAERERGLDHEEDWWSPGEISFMLSRERTAELVFSTEPMESIDLGPLVEDERRRRKRVVERAPKTDPLAQSLWCAAESYLSARGTGRTVVAGYPWFTDWGRDTFIALPGLCLVTGHHETAWEVIEAFASHVSEGMVPNWFPDAGEQPEYNTIDASLWFIHAVDRYLAYTDDDEAVRQFAWPAIEHILEGYRQGTRFGIRMDADGLITGGVPGAQLTWMDAKVGDWVVTPRHGKPVEIQALWIRALTIGEQLASRFGRSALAVRYRQDRDLAVRSFRSRFWYEAGGYLYDVIDGPGGDDASLRPNQIYAVALTDGVLTREQSQRIVKVVEEQLVTPVGLRTLAPSDLRYRPRYQGGVVERDGAYHQGTVWPFLLGPFVTAWLNAYGRSEPMKKKARAFLDGLFHHLSEACLGQVSEIFDAEAPHVPRGCFAQAWSVAEPLRALVEDLGITPAPEQTVLPRTRSRSRTSPTPTTLRRFR
jgi:predicted glycogen debranching enzyme